jgi:hypothetical protein
MYGTVGCREPSDPDHGGPSRFGSTADDKIPGTHSLQGKLVEGDRNLGRVRLLGPGAEVHTLPRTLDITAKFPLGQVPTSAKRLWIYKFPDTLFWIK